MDIDFVKAAMGLQIVNILGNKIIIAVLILSSISKDLVDA